MIENTEFQTVSASELDMVQKNVEDAETILQEQAVEGTDTFLRSIKQVTPVNEVVRDLVEAYDGAVTLYQVAKILNAALEIFDVQKNGELYQVRPQMMYNYNRNKMILKGCVIEGKVDKVIVQDFVTKFVNKLI